jgi:hypothetical protein
LLRSRFVAAATALMLSAVPAGAQFSTHILRPVGYHPAQIAYYSTPFFANALYQSGSWYSFTGYDWGTPIDYTTAQFVNGYPRYLEPGQRLRSFLYGLHTPYFYRPAGWPARDTLARGRIVVTWRGNADVRITSCPFVAAESSGDAAGALVDGRRVYMCTGPGQSTQSVEVHEILAPLTEMRVWLAPPDDPSTPVNENTTGSLEGQLFHPLLVQRIADADFGFIRFQEWTATQANPQVEWSDRRLPAHAFMAGVVNPRPPAPGYPGNRDTGVAWEYTVALSNLTGRNMWINVPHMATDDYIERLAKLILYGSDGVNPYDAPQANPVFAPLRGDLRVYVEYSNEIWFERSQLSAGRLGAGPGQRSGHHPTAVQRPPLLRYVAHFRKRLRGNVAAGPSGGALHRVGCLLASVPGGAGRVRSDPESAGAPRYPGGDDVFRQRHPGFCQSAGFRRREDVRRSILDERAVRHGPADGVR